MALETEHVNLLLVFIQLSVSQSKRAQAPGRRIASHFKLRALGLPPAPSASCGRAAVSVPYALRTRSPARLRQTSRLIRGYEVLARLIPEVGEEKLFPSLMGCI